MKDYPNSEIYERAFLIKLYHNKKLQKDYLDTVLPSVFLDKKRRLIVYLMKRLKESKMEISISNMVLFCSNPSDHLLSFIKRNNMPLLNEGELHDVLFEPGVDASAKLFDEAKKTVLDYSFARFVADSASEMNYYNSYYDSSYHPKILSRAKGIQTVHKILFEKENLGNSQLENTKERINSKDEYITSSSQVLNSYIGGFTRGFVDVVIGKSGHGKSTWTDYNILHTIKSGKVRKIVKITPEEPAEFSWRRYISLICRLSTTLMRQKLVTITDDHIKLVADELKDKIIIYDNVYKYRDVLELIRTIDCDQLYVDHIQSIDYPGKGGQLSNMISHIPGLVLFEEKIAKKRNMSIINLSQVGDKEIARSDRLSKRPRYHDAYGSSILYQKAREFLAVYYPYKDYDENPNAYFGSDTPTINDFEIGIEKSSFSVMGIVKMNFDYEYCVFKDKPVKNLKTDYIAPKENQCDIFGGKK